MLDAAENRGEPANDRVVECLLELLRVAREQDREPYGEAELAGIAALPLDPAEDLFALRREPLGRRPDRRTSEGEPVRVGRRVIDELRAGGARSRSRSSGGARAPMRADSPP